MDYKCTSNGLIFPTLPCPFTKGEKKKRVKNRVSTSFLVIQTIVTIYTAIKLYNTYIAKKNSSVKHRGPLRPNYPYYFV